MVRILIAAAAMLSWMPAAAAAVGPEGLRMGAEIEFNAMSLHLKLLAPEFSGSLKALQGPLLGSFVLAERLDGHRDVLTKQLGGIVYDIALANDPSFKIQYFSFRSGGQLLFKRIESLQKLRTEGIILTIDPKTTYKFKITPNIFDPVRGSSFTMDPVSPTQGPAHNLTTGELLDRIKAKSFLFRAGKKEYQVLYGTDVDPETEKLANTRSFLFTLEAGMNSKGWPIAEAALPLDRPTQVALDQTRIVLTRTSSGKLLINAAGLFEPDDESSR